MFLTAYRKTGIIAPTCDAVGVARTTLYKWREIDPKFAADMDQAGRDSLEFMANEAHRRGALGFEKGIYHQGVLVARELQYSDNLLMFMMKARDRKTYGDNQSLEVSGPGGGPIQHQDLTHLTDEQLAQIRAASALLEGPKKDA